MGKILLRKDYLGFESLNDISEDIEEAINNGQLPVEFQGSLRLTIEYVEEQNENSKH